MACIKEGLSAPVNVYFQNTYRLHWPSFTTQAGASEVIMQTEAIKSLHYLLSKNIAGNFIFFRGAGNFERGGMIGMGRARHRQSSALRFVQLIQSMVTRAPT